MANLIVSVVVAPKSTAAEPVKVTGASLILTPVQTDEITIEASVLPRGKVTTILFWPATRGKHQCIHYLNGSERL